MSNRLKTEHIKMDASHKALRTIQAGIILACLCGCRSATPPSTQSSPEPWWTEVKAFTSGLHRYVDATGSAPVSKEVLQDFCSTSNLPCATVDWSKFTCEWTDDGMVKATYHLDGCTIPISLAIPRRPPE